MFKESQVRNCMLMLASWRSWSLSTVSQSAPT